MSRVDRLRHLADGLVSDWATIDSTACARATVKAFVSSGKISEYAPSACGTGRYWYWNGPDAPNVEELNAQRHMPPDLQIRRTLLANQEGVYEATLRHERYVK